jgi:hypothetical protein
MCNYITETTIMNMMFKWDWLKENLNTKTLGICNDVVKLMEGTMSN